MKPTFQNPLLAATSIALLGSFYLARAAELYWDKDGDATTNIGGFGVWSTPLTWRDGSETGTLQNWVDGNTAVFGGLANAQLYVEVPDPIIVSQLKFISGGNGLFFNIGRNAANTANTSGTITFSGTYNSTTPAIDTSALTADGSTSISSKITGTIAGGLVINASSNLFAGYSNTTCGRLYLRSDSNNDFIGDVTVLSGSLDARSLLGNANNKLILAGGGIISLTAATAATTTYSVARDIEVTADSSLGNWAGNSGTNRTVVVDLAAGKTISGSGNLTRYLSTTAVTGGNKEEIRLSGGMSGYTGTVENHGGVTVIQTTSTSDGAWQVTGGTLKLNTTDNTHIADGAGKSNLLMNGGTLDLNGKSETINGLDGSSATIQNQLASTTSTLTLGAGDATAYFDGVIRNNTTSGGKVALVKIGSGTQTLAGSNIHTGDTTVTAGTLVLGTMGSLRFAPTITGVSNKLTGAGTANLNGTLDIDLSTAAATVGNSWTLVDIATANYALAGITSTPALTFTQTGSIWTAPAGPVIWKFNQTSGILSVEAPSGYATWITTPAFGLAPADQDPGDDPDNDGVENLLEFVLNGNPSASSPGILPIITTTATDFEFTFSRRDDSLSPETTQTFQYGTTLGAWTNVLVPAASSTIGAAIITVTDGSPADSVKISIPKTEAGATGKLFGRLQATKP